MQESRGDHTNCAFVETWAAVIIRKRCERSMCGASYLVLNVLKVRTPCRYDSMDAYRTRCHYTDYHTGTMTVP
jgi:hypothetical protein